MGESAASILQRVSLAVDGQLHVAVTHGGRGDDDTVDTTCGITTLAPGSVVPNHASRYYKVVAVVGERFFSIYDGTTEYRLGETLHSPCREGHRGGLYVSHTLQV